MVRVLLVDDNAQFRWVLRRLLERDPEIAVVAEAADGREALDAAGRHVPDVVVMDMSMPGIQGCEATAAIRSAHPDMAVVILSAADDDRELTSGIDRGAAEYLLKGAPADDIVQAIKRHDPVLRGG